MINTIKMYYIKINCTPKIEIIQEKKVYVYEHN